MKGSAQFGGITGVEPVEFAHLTGSWDLPHSGLWFVIADFEGRTRAWRFATTYPTPAHTDSHSTPASNNTSHLLPAHPQQLSWDTTMDQDTYEAGVNTIKDHVREGRVYQANLTRIVHTPLAYPGPARLLHNHLRIGNPAPYGGYLDVTDSDPQRSAWLVSASPELFLSTTVDPHDSDTVTITSSPIKGTAPTPAGLTTKDEAENIMITDLVRNDLSHIATPGTVIVDTLLGVEPHPGLVHLVSTVQARLRTPPRNPTAWRDIFAATFPPASVSGAPKSSALEVITELEPTPRGPYCGAFGWINTDTGHTQLAVGIRTFWWDPASTYGPGARLHFGTGAGITWGSTPTREWQETQLKARTLMGLVTTHYSKEPQ